MGSLNWTKRSDLNANFSVSISGKKPGSFNCFCSIYKRSISTAVSGMPDLSILGTINGSTTYIKDSNYTDKDSFISAVTGQKIIYELTTPITYSLAPTQLQTFLGTNNVWSNADYVEVEYDLHETQDILARKQFIMASQPHVEEASGAIATFNTDMAAKLKECKVGFKPVQEGEGDPSPENVRAISGWTGCEAYVVGKNLIDESYLADANNYPNSGSYGYHYTNDIQLVPNTRYRFVWYDYDNTELSELGTTNINLYVSGANEYIVNNANYRQYSSGFITPATGIIRLGIYHPSSLQRQDVLDAIFNNGKLLLQIGVEDTSYEPYTGTTLPIDWSDSAWTIYGGYVDLVKGEMVKTHGLFTVDEPNAVWEVASKTNIRITFARKYVFSSRLSRNASACTILPENASTNWTYGYVDNTRTTDAYHSLCLCYTGNGDGWAELIGETATVENAKSYLRSIGFAICATLIEPFHYLIDPTTLKTLRGTNNIWSNANGNIELSYWKH